MNFLKYCWLVIRLVITNAIFIFQVLFARISKFSLISIFYVLILLQGLLVAGLFIQQNQLENYQTAQQQLNSQISESINFDQVKNEQKTDFYLAQDQAKYFLKKHKENLQKNPTHRDLLINTAILELKLNQNTDKFNQLIQQAKKTDPNWVGWKN